VIAFYANLRRISFDKCLIVNVPVCEDGDACFTPKSGHVRCNLGCPLWARSGLMHRSKQHLYSINSSARPSSVFSVMVDFQARAPARPSTSTNLLTVPQDNQR
jgi:hypothetical protein